MDGYIHLKGIVNRNSIFFRSLILLSCPPLVRLSSQSTRRSRRSRTINASFPSLNNCNCYYFSSTVPSDHIRNGLLESIHHPHCRRREEQSLRGGSSPPHTTKTRVHIRGSATLSCLEASSLILYLIPSRQHPPRILLIPLISSGRPTRRHKLLPNCTR